MSKDYWKEVQRTAEERLNVLRVKVNALDAEREELAHEIVQLEQVLNSVRPFTSESPMDGLNANLIENATERTLADACREVLKVNDKYMTPREIRDTLAASGFDLSKYNNPLAGIHGVLKRMVENGEITDLAHETKGTLYRNTGFWASLVRSTAVADMQRQLEQAAKKPTRTQRPDSGRPGAGDG